MAYHEHEQEYQKRLSFAQAKNALITLVAINLVLFVILAFIQAIYYLQYGEPGVDPVALFNARVLKWFALPANMHELIARPWTIITHMFVHTGVWHIVGNMLWLWVFGYILQDLTGNRKIFPIYIYGALGGALAFILAYNFLPALKPMMPVASAIGASAGVMAIAAAVTTIAPGYRIFPMLNGGIPIWIITIFYLVIDLATIPLNNPGGHIAHLAGALTGFLFVYSFRRGHDWGGWMNRTYDWVNDLFNPDRPRKGKSIKQELFYKSSAHPYKRTPNVTAQRIDEILDKINLRGYNSLTEEEKELLKRASKEDI
ncbi:MAG TPA: rhomboid family intramembrane serine protease [Chitinophagaceae bacterium]|nr:rhomboid family intramembrane serine protease [Chitinophagaceae bacterium]